MERQSAETAATLDLVSMLDRVGGDNELLREITAIFLEEFPLLMQEIREAVESGDARKLEHAAHSLKGSVSNFGAPEAVDAAARLEMLGRAAQLSSAGDALRRLEEQFENLQPALRALASTGK